MPGTSKQHHTQLTKPGGTNGTTAMTDPNAEPNNSPKNKRHRSKSPEKAEHDIGQSGTVEYNPAETAGVREGHLADDTAENYLAVANTAATGGLGTVYAGTGPEADNADIKTALEIDIADIMTALEQNTAEVARAAVGQEVSGTDIVVIKTEEAVEVTPIEPAGEAVVEIKVEPPVDAPDDEKVGRDAPQKNHLI